MTYKLSLRLLLSFRCCRSMHICSFVYLHFGYLYIFKIVSNERKRLICCQLPSIRLLKLQYYFVFGKNRKLSIIGICQTDARIALDHWSLITFTSGENANDVTTMNIRADLRKDKSHDDKNGSLLRCWRNQLIKQVGTFEWYFDVTLWKIENSCKIWYLAKINLIIWLDLDRVRNRHQTSRFLSFDCIGKTVMIIKLYF